MTPIVGSDFPSDLAYLLFLLDLDLISPITSLVSLA